MSKLDHFSKMIPSAESLISIQVNRTRQRKCMPKSTQRPHAHARAFKLVHTSQLWVKTVMGLACSGCLEILKHRRDWLSQEDCCNVLIMGVLHMRHANNK